MTDSTITLSDSAAKRIAHLIAKEAHPENAKLRISVDGGGCSGFQYKYDFVDDSPASDDLVLNKNGATVLIDELSQQYMQGAVIDYIEKLGASFFEIKNPNTTAQCGCGNSFNVM